MFGGRLTPDFVAEKLGHSNFLDVREMDLPNSGIRIVDLGAGDVFTNLRRYMLTFFWTLKTFFLLVEKFKYCCYYASGCPN